MDGIRIRTGSGSLKQSCGSAFISCGSGANTFRQTKVGSESRSVSKNDAILEKKNSSKVLTCENVISLISHENKKNKGAVEYVRH